MTDRFEEAVRQAAQGLGDGSTELPSYHGAWQRGRRRRLVKKAGLSAAGAFLLIAAVAVGMTNLPDRSVTQETEVAVSAAPATAVPLATTAPVQPPPTLEPISPPATTLDVAPEIATVEPSSPEPSPEVDPEPPVSEPTTPPAVASEVVETPTAVPLPTSTEPPATPTPPEPTPTEPPVAEAVEGDQAQNESFDSPVAPDADPDPDLDPGAAANPSNGFATSTGVPDGVGSGSAADAVLTGPAGGIGPLPCDLDQDGVEDTLCTLMAPYPCSAAIDAAAGYQVVDQDQDGVLDTCIATVSTTCDTTGDGLGDMPCSIDSIATTEESAVTE